MTGHRGRSETTGKSHNKSFKAFSSIRADREIGTPLPSKVAKFTLNEFFRMSRQIKDLRKHKVKSEQNANLQQQPTGNSTDSGKEVNLGEVPMKRTTLLQKMKSGVTITLL